MSIRFLILSLFSFLQASVFCQSITIELKNNHPNELACKTILDGLLNKYDLSKWLFTKHIIIDYKTNIPYSHPVLTLTTRHNRDEELLLSTFIHEQLHWFVNSKRSAAFDTALLQLKIQFPNAPAGYPSGAIDSESSYTHLIVNYLEIKIMKELVGELKASQVLQFWMNDHYTWIYEQVYKKGFFIYKILMENGLMPK